MTLADAGSAAAPPRWVRTAYWVGAPRAGSERAFRELIEDELLPAFRALPGVRAARAWWPVHREADPPAVALQFVVEFDSRADLDRMLASDERRALRPAVERAAALFDGHASHIEHEER